MQPCLLRYHARSHHHRKTCVLQAATLRQLVIVLTGIVGSIWAMNASWSEKKDIYVSSSTSSSLH